MSILNQPHRNIRFGQMLFHLAHGVFAKMKNARCQYRIRLAFLQDIHHVVKIARPQMVMTI